MRRLLLPALLTGALASGYAGCRPTQLTGEAIGQYEVRGELVENTCEGGYAAPETLYFHVELRVEPGSRIGYWKLSDAPLASGELDRPAGTFHFEDRQTVVGIDAAPGQPGCVLERLETVAGALSGERVDGGPVDGGIGDAGALAPDAQPERADGGDAGAARPSGEARFDGTTVVRVSTASGDCSPLIDPSRGGFPALPCEVRYAMSGERLDEDLW